MTRKILPLMLVLLLAAACGTAAPPATLTIRITNIPAGTQAVMVETDASDDCHLLPRRYAPQAAANLVLERRCFQGYPTYNLIVWTYDSNCCIRSLVTVAFDGDTDPTSRALSNLVVNAPLQPAPTVDCRPGLICGPQ